MTLRERIADWISGGALIYARETIKLERSQRQYRYSAEFIPLLVLAEGAEARAAAMEESLRAIAALETPHANATVRKMARIAREAVKRGDTGLAPTSPA